MPHDHPHDHSHSHAHDHAHGSHAHDHDHAHDHAHGEHSHADHAHANHLARADLPPGAGIGKILYFDAPSGLAGDMIIAALIDLGVPVRVVEEAVSALKMSGFHLHLGAKAHSGIVGTHFDVHVEEAQHERTYGEIRGLIDRSSLTPSVKARAHKTFLRLAESEAKVHRSSLDDVHFHEVGAIDAIVDVVGSAAALDYIGASLVVSPLPMGHGTVKARHGILPLPAPATVECLRGLDTYDGGLAFEFVTPTGAAICGAHAERSSAWPSIAPTHIGWGAGTATLADRPNLLRVVLGDDARGDRSSSPESAEATHTVLEANLDDATGELVAHVIDLLLKEGAKDAWATPITMKKGRPAYVLSALSDRVNAQRIADAMIRETTTLGVRRTDATRVERPREMGSVTTTYGEVPVKIARGAFGPPQVKPEVERARAIAEAAHVPLRVVLAAALAAAYEKYQR